MSFLRSLINSLPPVCIFFLIMWCYYSYVVQFCIFYLTNPSRQAVYITIYNVVLMMFVWTFLKTMLTCHSEVPDEYRLTNQEHLRLLEYSDAEANSILKKVITLRRLEVYTCAPNGHVRYCKHCQLIKPDRTHHCSTCKRCILKMDHHCPWIANCVAFNNYKNFILLMFYGTIWSVFYAGTIMEFVVDIWKDLQHQMHKIQIAVGFLLAATVGALLSVLLLYHMSLVCRNETTLEALRDPTFIDDNLTFDLGPWLNFTEVFGDNVCCWLCPTESAKGNGYEFSVQNLIH